MTDIRSWLEQHNLSKYAEVFADNEIEVADLPDLTEDDLRELGLPMGPRKRLLNIVDDLITSATGSKGSTKTILGKFDFVAPFGEAERRQLTVMFCDLVGSTSLSIRFDPEDYREIIRDYQNAVSKCIHEYDGYIARYLGDGMLIYFGYPQAHEDDAERAVRSGLAVTNALAAGSPRPDLDFQVRIGIATGIVVVGDLIGEGASEERAVIGETPNLAARLQGLAEPNAIVVSEATRALLADKFEWQDFGARVVKGFDQPIRPWLLKGQQDTRPSLANSTDHSRPMVDRKKEFQLLLEQWKQVRDTGGRAILIDAEPGVGKSRLVRELNRHIQDDNPTVALLLGSPYFVNSALYPVTEHLTRMLGYNRNELNNIKLRKLDQYAETLDLDPASFVPVLAPMLGIDLESQQRYKTPTLTPSELRRRNLEALADWYQRMSIQAPLLLVVEDLHWVDPTTIELLGQILERIASTRIFALLTFRPQFIPPWPTGPVVESLTLLSLAEQDSRELISHLAGETPLSEELVDQLIDRTDGVPLFLEELARALLETSVEQSKSSQGNIEHVTDIPATLRDALMGRLDRLNAVKEIAQLASVIGRSFSFDLLLSVSSLDQSGLSHALSTLVDAGIVDQAHSDNGQVNYEFRHALIRDAAYDSLLRRKRQHLHKRVATALTESGTAVLQPELLGHHYTEAREHDKAIDYWLLAGQTALTRSANQEAIGHLRRGLAELAFIAEVEKRERQELALRTMIGPALIATTGFASEAVGEQYARARKLCQKYRGSPQLFPALWGSWVFSLVRGELDSSRSIAEEMLALGEQTDGSAMLVEAHWTLGNSLYWLGELRESLVHLRRALQIYDSAAHQANALIYGQDPGVAAKCYLAYCQWQLGFPDSALEALDQAWEMAETRDHAFTRGWALAFRFVVHAFRRDPVAAQSAAERVIEYCTDQSYPFWLSAAIIVRGWSRANNGEPAAGIEEMRKGIAMYEQIGCSVVQPTWFGLLAETLLAVNDGDGAVDALDRGFSIAKRNHEVISEIDLWRIRGELLASDESNDLHAAFEAFNHARELAHQCGARSLELRAACGIHKILGRSGLALDTNPLPELFATFDQGFGTRDFAEANELLGNPRSNERLSKTETS